MVTALITGLQETPYHTQSFPRSRQKYRLSNYNIHKEYSRVQANIQTGKRELKSLELESDRARILFLIMSNTLRILMENIGNMKEQMNER